MCQIRKYSYLLSYDGLELTLSSHVWDHMVALHQIVTMFKHLLQSIQEHCDSVHIIYFHCSSLITQALTSSPCQKLCSFQRCIIDCILYSTNVTVIALILMMFSFTNKSNAESLIKLIGQLSIYWLCLPRRRNFISEIKRWIML